MATKAKSDPDFASLMKELEAIVAWFEQDEVDLDESIAKFERGMELAEALKKRLAEVENRVQAIQAKFNS